MWRSKLYIKKRTENYQSGTGFFVHKRIILAVKRVEFFSDRLSYIVLKVAGVMLLVSMCMPHLRIREMTQRTVSMRNKSRHLISFISTICKCC